MEGDLPGVRGRLPLGKIKTPPPCLASRQGGGTSAGGLFNPLRLPDLLPASPAGKGIGGQQGLLGQLDEPLSKVGEIAVPAVAHHQLADGGGSVSGNRSSFSVEA